MEGLRYGAREGRPRSRRHSFMSIGVVVADPRVLHENAVRNVFVQLPRTSPASRSLTGKNIRADRTVPEVQPPTRSSPLFILARRLHVLLLQALELQPCPIFQSNRKERCNSAETPSPVAMSKNNRSRSGSSKQLDATTYGPIDSEAQL